jgi:sugar phosphate isomerase/epimerase
MPRLSLCPLTIIRATHRELVEAAAAGGFGAVGFRLIAPRPGDPVHPIEGVNGLGDLRKLMSDNGIALFDIESLWLSPATAPEAIRPALEICAALGGKNLLIAGNDPELDRMAANFAAVAQIAMEYGVRPCIEPTSWCAVHRLDQAKDLIRRSDATNAGVIIDTLHMDRAGETPASIAAFDPTLIAYAQICDAGPQRPGSSQDLMAEARGNRLLPGEGALPLGAMLDALPQGLTVGVEAPTQELAALSFVEAARRAGDATRTFFAMREAHN